MSLYLPLPSPRIGQRQAAEPRQPRTQHRQACYGPLIIEYTCTDTRADGETDREVRHIYLHPTTPADRTSPEACLHHALTTLMTAHHITYDELIENAPHRHQP
ncbi:hypothetical protein [Prosthecobacter dejongeii]|uniref:Uncharacterized protein n=1 Tax=Prosthecobacter dejongeii TaxID=48465 RepID=A0A7W7YR27_9BACT|nr:hypothetical protein [Prosthecobacter dejongeii]MBB5040617.1 hypothetical protein [Prosthecobacter dejongeii]